MHIYAKQKNCKLKQKFAEASSKLNVGTSIRLRNILASNFDMQIKVYLYLNVQTYTSNPLLPFLSSSPKEKVHKIETGVISLNFL